MIAKATRSGARRAHSEGISWEKGREGGAGSRRGVRRLPSRSTDAGGTSLARADRSRDNHAARFDKRRAQAHTAAFAFFQPVPNKRTEQAMAAGFADIFVQMAILFAVGAAGYAAKRLRLMDEDFDKKLSKLILNISLPAMILASVLTAESLPSPSQVLWTMAVACLSYVVLIAVGFAVTAALRVPHGSRGAYRFMLVFGNTGFLGYPVIMAIFGAQGVILATIFNLAFNCLVFTVGVWFLAQDNEYGVKVKMGPKAFLSPSIVSCAAALALTFANAHGVPVVGEALDTLGSLTTPAAMMIIGSSLANMPVRELIGGPRLAAAALVRLVVTPLLIWLAFRFFVDDPLLLGVLVVISAMPVATNGTMLSYQYGGDVRTMAQGTFLTTVCSLVTIPLLAVFLGM